MGEVIRQGTITDALKRYVDASKQNKQVLAALERYMLLNPREENRSHKVLHPSEVAADGWCPRYNQMVMEDRIPTKREILSLHQRSIFAYGHLAHAKWQGWFAEAGMLWGLWEPKHGGAGSLFGYPPENLGDYTYAEVPLNFSIWGGHADGILRLKENRHLLLEIKTVGMGTIRYGNPSLVKSSGGDLDRAFNMIDRPFDSHMRQAQIYAELFLRHPEMSLGDDSHRLDEIVFLYELKSNQNTKELVVPRDDSYIYDLMEQADLLVEYLDSGDLIPCPHGGKCKCGGNDG